MGLKVNCYLEAGIAGRGFTMKRGMHAGDLDDTRGVVWVEVASTNRIPGGPKTRTVAVSPARFSYLEEAKTAPAAAAVDPRAEVREKIQAANAEKAKREGGKTKAPAAQQTKGTA